MHTLTLLRHAKSDPSVDVTDRKRPLNKQGIRDAPVMAKRLQKRGYIPDIMISSYALRAETTAKAFADALGSELVLDKALYNVDETSAINIIRAMDEDVKDLMLIGHNPAWEVLAGYLSGSDITLPACAIVQISFECAWKKVDGGSGKILYFDYPKKGK
ncbi:MAG: histidine phosphatase family protein [Sulfurimonadaceae bacterium]